MNVGGYKAKGLPEPLLKENSKIKRFYPHQERHFGVI